MKEGWLVVLLVVKRLVGTGVVAERKRGQLVPQSGQEANNLQDPQ